MIKWQVRSRSSILWGIEKSGMWGKQLVHEAAIARNILDCVFSRTRRFEPQAIARTVRVRIGQFRNVDLDSLGFAFDSLKDAYSTCISCELSAEAIAAVALCRQQQHEYHPDPANAFRCDRCGSGIGRLLAGEELDIIDIELEIGATAVEVEHARVS